MRWKERSLNSVHQGRGRLIPSEGYPFQCEWERITLQATLQSSEEEEFEHEEDEDTEKLPTQRGQKRKADNKKQTKKSDVSKAKEVVKKRKNNSNTMEETGNQIVPKKESFQQNEAKQRKDARE